MPELPSGTVTFLFTDVEGSTRLLKGHRDRYGEMLADHRRILRAAFEEHEGQEIDTQGDAFFVAFRRARDAALAAAAAQRALAEHPWPEGAELRVRMGLHTGEPTVGDEGYHGFGVHRAARIMAAGHGGQVLASQATCSVLEDDELPGIRLRELGEYRLKDLDRRERIYQLDVEGLPQEFASLRTADAPTAYSGLEEDLEQAARAAVWQARFWTRRRLAVGVAGLLAAAALAAVLALVLGGSAKALSRVDANTLGLIDAGSKRIVGEVPVGATPTAVASGEGAIWVTNADDHSVSRIDPATNSVVDTIPVGSSPSGIATGDGAVWVANSLDETVSRIDPVTNAVVQEIPVGTFPVGIVYAARSVWVANTGDGTITRIDAGSGETKTLPVAATELAFGARTLWASDRTANRVTRIDPATGGVVATIPVGNGPAGLAFGSGAAWVANSLDGTVSRVDPATNAVPGVIPVGNGPTAVAAGAGGIWVTNQFGGTLARIDPRTNDVERIAVGNRPQGVAVAGNDVLVTVRQSGAGHRGGTLRIRTNRDIDAIDTAVAYDSSSWGVLRMTNDGLVAFNQTSGLQGNQLVPNLAVSLPAPTDGGRTYTFKLRSSIRYSTGKPVKPSDFRSTFERDFKIGKLPVTYYDNVVGAARCKKVPKRCDLSDGIVTDDAAKKVTFHLVEPDPEFLYKLAINFAYVLPSGTPAKQAHTNPLPATGPYVISRYRPQRLLELSRNPHFHEWSKAAQPDGYPDEIVFDVGGTPDAAMDNVINGKADLFSSRQSATPPSKDRLAAIETRYASQVRKNPQPTTIGLFLNARLAPFDRLGVRRAVNYAADRAAAVEATGGPDVAQATCQILPPSFPGYRPYCPYRRDLAKARALVAASGTRGMKITVWSWTDLSGVGPFAVKLLRSLGYRATMKSVSGFGYFGIAFNSRTEAQVGAWEWISDWAAASAFFTQQFTCGSFLPHNPANLNPSEFCDPLLDRQIEKAVAEQVTNPAAARLLWARIDRQTADQAPMVPLVNPKAVDILSKRVGNYQYNLEFGPLFDQLWVK